MLTREERLSLNEDGHSMVWEAVAEYADGTTVRELFPYHECGNASRENERQYEIESWLIATHEDCIWYSVGCIEED